MALVSSAASPNPRRPKAFAVRSFPPLCGPLAASSPDNGSCLRNGNRESSSVADRNSPADPTSCNPATSLCGHVFKRPIVFAIRNFPKGCGPCVPAMPKPSDTKPALSEFSNGIPGHKRIELLPSDENGELSKKVRLSTVRTFPDSCGPDGSETKAEAPNDFTKIMGEVSKGGKFFVSATNNEIGDKVGFADNAKEVSKRGRVSTVRNFPNGCKPGFSEANNAVEVKKEFLDNVSKVPKERHKLSRAQAKGAEFNSKRSLIPNRMEDCVTHGDIQLEERGDRLIILALMAAPHCPWRQGKRKNSSSVQPKEKKPRIKEKE
ncbi:hypothetical protein HPP92_003964 [Vanilla planifolia]|uniref:Uncharacterized protein n=1 Tax=Vanilla planifolia TaxID=51239 RepID=A0A835RYM1_VANPL|nr:hypothetical protein HPP92_003964 [Vanilla planifolia]